MNELKSCPFCGGEAEKKTARNYISSRSNGTYILYIQCSKCGARTIGYHWDDEKLAINAWNRRKGND